jgi:hypothetical protein
MWSFRSISSLRRVIDAQLFVSRPDYLRVLVFDRGLVGGAAAGTFMVGPLTLLPDPWPRAAAPAFRIRLPLPSLTLETPFWACTDVPHKKIQKIASGSLIRAPRRSGPVLWIRMPITAKWAGNTYEHSRTNPRCTAINDYN